MEINFLVQVSCITYNHALYIEDAMNGFCKQETSFPYICTIVDDASTDGEQEVIKKYLQEHFDLENKDVVRTEDTDDYVMIFAQHKDNNNCYFIVYYLKYNHYRVKKSKSPYFQKWQEKVKYIAMCEGDDYWTNSLKLQKQVDYLEDNPDYSMCFHKAFVLKEIENQDIYLKCGDIENREYNPNELFLAWKVPTASIVVRREVMNVKNKGENRILNRDIIYVLNCFKCGKIRGMSDVMSVYRIQSSGVTYDLRLKNARIMRYPDHFLFIKDNYPFLDKKITNRKIALAYMERSKLQNNFFRKIVDNIWAIYFYPHGILRKLTGHQYGSTSQSYADSLSVYGVANWGRSMRK